MWETRLDVGTLNFAVGCWLVKLWVSGLPLGVGLLLILCGLGFAVYESGNECLLWHERAFLCRQSEFLCITGNYGEILCGLR